MKYQGKAAADACTSQKKTVKSEREEKGKIPGLEIERAPTSCFLSVRSVFSTVGRAHSQGNDHQGLCVSSKCVQAARYLLRMLQFNVACLESAAVTW